MEKKVFGHNITTTTHQWCPVGVEVTNPQSWDELGECYDQEIQVDEELELLIQHLHTRDTGTRQRRHD